MGLKHYNEKRNFNITLEPKGKKKSSKNLRFVIQHHFSKREHFDFRIEHKGVLISFAVPKGLPIKSKEKHLAVMVEDHPIDYINFEGEIPKGQYGAGKVEIYDKGTYSVEKDVDKLVKEGVIKLALFGKKIKGEYHLIKLKDKNWIIIKSNNKSINHIKKVEVKLAKLSLDIPKSKEYVYEIKYDGYRIVSFIEKGKIKLISRNHNDFSSKFLSVCEDLKFINDNCILDGEIVVFDDKGRSDFSILKSSITNKENNFCYVVFDILFLNGEDLRNKKLFERKEILKKVLLNSPKNIIFSEHIIGNGKKCFNFAKKNNLEGIIAKNINSVYSPNKDEDWLKIKCYKQEEFVIGGFTTTNSNPYLSALLIGYYKNKELIFLGKVGTGFDDKKRKELNKILIKLKTNKSYFKYLSNLKNENVIFTKPKLVAVIKFSELTKTGIRQPSFIELREDKNSNEVILEQVDD